MTFQFYRNELLKQIRSYLNYLPYCTLQESYKIMDEIQVLRGKVNKINAMPLAESRKQISFYEREFESIISKQNEYY